MKQPPFPREALVVMFHEWTRMQANDACTYSAVWKFKHAAHTAGAFHMDIFDLYKQCLCPQRLRDGLSIFCNLWAWELRVRILFPKK